MPISQWSRQLIWSGPQLTLNALRHLVSETNHLPEDTTVHVTSYNDQRDGTQVTLRVDGIRAYEPIADDPASLADTVLLPPEAVYVKPYLNIRTGIITYTFFDSDRNPVDINPALKATESTADSTED